MREERPDADCMLLEFPPFNVGAQKKHMYVSIALSFANNLPVVGSRTVVSLFDELTNVSDANSLAGIRNDNNNKYLFM